MKRILMIDTAKVKQLFQKAPPAIVYVPSVPISLLLNGKWVFNQVARMVMFIMILLLILFQRSSAQMVETLCVDFSKYSTRNAHVDTVRGILFFFQGRTVLQVSYPLRQWMEWQGQSLLIYYPQDNKAIRFMADMPWQLPFFQPFLSGEPFFNHLEKIGFSLQRTDEVGDTLISYWAPKNPQKIHKGTFVLKMDQHRLYATDFHDKKRKLWYRTRYDHFFVYGKTHIPLKMYSCYQSNDERREELILFANPVINQMIPPEVMNFSLPEGTKIEEIKW